MSGPTRVWQATLDGLVECWTFWDAENSTRAIVDSRGRRVLDVYGVGAAIEKLPSGFYWMRETATLSVVELLREWLSVAETERREAHARELAIERQTEREWRRALLHELER